MNNNWYVYVILCENGSLYKGHTNDLKRRYNEHLKGIGAKYTKINKPLKIVYHEIYQTLEEAVKREKYLKSGIGREWLEKKLKEVIK